ncbi:MAG TPA: hypothetical protein VJS44_06135 [Pyrinomonadaceae bacterium]|nr:hypothetical protein [Pyrinomonadaceae bacterium]
MAQVIDVEDNNCSLRGFERNRYFFGKPMMVRDFDAEQQYFNGKRYLLNRLVHGRGIVCGLNLLKNTNGGGFTLKAGAAIDCCGREIVVGSDYTKTDLKDMEGYRDDIVTQNLTIYFCLVYDECIREPIRAQANTSSCGDVCDYNRIREGFKVVIKETAPAASANFCELTSSKKVVFEDARFRLERIAPLWVNPKDVFEVLLIATPKNINGTLTVDVEEAFSPAGQLSVVQGIPPLTKRISFSLTQAGGVVTKPYLLRAGETTVDTEIKATVFFPQTTQQSAENQSSAVGIKSERISDLIAAKIFRDEELGTCPSCKEDHCIYLASARIGEDSVLAGVEKFPSNQYVYNNPLLYNLIACGEKRIGKLPEIPVSNKTTQVLPAVTAFKFFDGLTAADGGLGLANVTAKVDKGLKIDNDSITADLGRGTVFDGNHISADIDKGLMFDGNHVKADLGKGVIFDGNHISADLGNGLIFDANHIAARTGQGVKLSGNLIAANLGDGLVLDGSDRITPSTANGVKISGSQIQPDYSTSAQAGKVCEANDPRLSNARTPLPHAPTHQAGGADQLNVQNLPGTLLHAQKVEVQDEGTSVGTRTRLNFMGTGVTVTDDAAQSRVNISIPQSGRVSTGTVKFVDVRPGEYRQSNVIDHLQEAGPCAIVLAFVEGQTASGEFDFFGDLEDFGTVPAMLAYHSTGTKEFIVALKDRRRDTQESQTFTVRWWAVPKNLDAPPVVVNPPVDVTRATEEAVRLSISMNPGIKREELASRLAIDVTEVDKHTATLRTSNKINVVGTRFFAK